MSKCEINTVTFRLANTASARSLTPESTVINSETNNVPHKFAHSFDKTSPKA